MKKTFKIIGAIALGLMLSIAIAIASLPGASFPQGSGTIELPNLQDTVTVRRDRWGIPHIYASNQHDLFFAQGYVHAQDRFWQMDFWRHLGSGRLAELFGQSEVSNDRFLRTLGWARIAQQEIDQRTPQELAILNAYAEGVNAYLADRQGSALSLEYAVLKLLNPTYQPEPWQPLHTLTWSKVMAWDLGLNMEMEIERAVLLDTLTPGQVEELFPPYPSDRPIIVESRLDNVETRHVASGSRGAEEQGSRGEVPSSQSKIQNLKSKILCLMPYSQSLHSAAKQVAALNSLVGDKGSGIGSNSWAISGKRTATGRPLLANDPHMGVEMPSIWYEVGLHCTQKSPECPYEVTGFSFPGMVGVIIGHNDRVAWGFTATIADVMDLFVEKINPNNPNQYEVNGEWADIEKVEEIIPVAGGDAVTQTVRYTRHGPIISDTYDKLESIDRNAYLQLPQNYAIALRWTALEPSNLFSMVIEMNRAQNWEEFRRAARNFDIASQNLVYADVEGNIGYQMPGKIPIRDRGNGRYPVPGWTGEFDWQGYIPFEELPVQFNPPEGYIVNANHRIVGKEYPYAIATDWEYGFRAQRILDLIEGQAQPFSLEDIEQIQTDNRNPNAEFLVPRLLELSFDEERLRRARNLLQDWDFQQGIDDAAPALFEMFWRKLLAAAFHDDLPQEYFPKGDDRWVEVVSRIVEQSDSVWWDNRRTPARETRDEIIRQAFAQAVSELEQTFGSDPQTWRWGALHTITFRHPTLGKSGIAPIEALFNRGAFETSGGNAIINAMTWDASQSFEVFWIPAMRMLVDVGNWDNSRSIHSTGQSGHAFHRHYDDMIEPWQTLQYHAMLWSEEAVETNATSSLTLVPSSMTPTYSVRWGSGER